MHRWPATAEVRHATRTFAYLDKVAEVTLSMNVLLETDPDPFKQFKRLIQPSFRFP